MRKQRRDIEVFTLSFLDMVSCGFGAVILLLVIVLAAEPATVRHVAEDMRNAVARKDSSRAEIVAESQALTRALAEKTSQLAALETRVAALSGDWEKIQREQATSQAKAQAQARVEQQLKIVQQSMSEEMKRLLGQPDYRPPKDNATIGGIPVDSEYIIFVIDTSGSMKEGAWPLVIRKVEEVLSVYPRVKGIQVLSDGGDYMFPTYANQWIPDTPSRREVILQQLRRWSAASPSNPTNGILRAIQSFRRSDQAVSIFVFGDDFNGPNIDEVVTTVARMNGRTGQGQAQVRIHTFGFPVWPILGPQQGYAGNFIRFAHLMRVLAEQNSGSFVGLNSIR